MIEHLYLFISSIAAVASVIGAIFAIWRWDFAKKSFDLQQKQVYLQILMLAESREYWYLPKMDYVEKKAIASKDIDDQIKRILKELRNVNGNM